MPMRSTSIRLLLTALCGLLVVAGLAFAAVSSTGSLTTARTQLTATALPAGGATTQTVLAAGGFNAAGVPLATAERYDVTTGAWTATGSMTAAHADHHAVPLPSGSVFVVGGRSLLRGAIVVDSQSAEQYIPATNTWTGSATKPTAGVDDTATLVPFRAGPRVVVAGGRPTGGAAVGTVETYDPATDVWAPVSDMLLERRGHAAVTLPDGRLLVAGGFNANGGLTATTEIYSDLTNTWTPGPAMTIPRADFTLSVVDGTHILAAGGITNVVGGPTAATATAEVLNPTAGGWQSAGSLAVARSGQQATVVRSGWVVLTGGTNAASPDGLDSAEQWTPTNGWGGLYNLGGATPIGGARVGHGAAAIPQSDEVLVVGGGALPSPPGVVSATAARWSPDRPVVVAPTTTSTTTPTPTPTTPPAVVPVQNRSLVAATVSGSVFVRIGKTDEYRELRPGEPVPVGTVLDTSDGRVQLVAAIGGGVQTAWFWGGTFTVLQPKGAGGYVEIRLFGKPVCKKASKKATRLVKRKKKPKVWGDGKGKFRTKGANSSASVSGTKWLVEERCTGTFTKVERGSVKVRDFTKRKTVTVKAGKNYLARPPRR